MMNFIPLLIFRGLVILTIAAGIARPSSGNEPASIPAHETVPSTKLPDFALADRITGPNAFEKPDIINRFLPERNSRERFTTETVSRLIVHFCSAIMTQPEDPHSVQGIVDIFTSYTVSAHYLIDREGGIHCLVPEERVAFHAGPSRLPGPPFLQGQLNGQSIGIELLAMGSPKDMEIFFSRERHAELFAKRPEWFGYTDAQYKALGQLVADVLRRHPGILPDRQHILGHDEIAPGRKTDPGEWFDYTRIGLPQALPEGWASEPPETTTN
jgi:N-acetyl-anhydromuramyl-L-alanine amidase AmpD